MNHLQAFLPNFCEQAGLKDAGWVREVRTWMMVSLGLLVLAAYLSVTYYAPDEHFQILELLLFKLSGQGGGQLAWEYHEQIRSWFQVGLYYLPVKLLWVLGLQDTFILGFLIRLGTGLLFWLSLWLVMLACRRWFDGEVLLRSLALKVLAVLFVIPFFMVRTSSENFGVPFFMAALVLLDLERERPSPGLSAYRPRVMFLAGCLLGLSFLARYQNAFIFVGAWLWLVFVTRKDLRALVKNSLLLGAGGALAALVGVAVDSWGYGGFSFAPWNYFRVNILMGISGAFGEAPFWAYLNPFYIKHHLKVWGAAGVLVWVYYPLILAMVLGWIRFPRHIFTWASACFFLFHSLVSHKEPRFLIPLFVMAAVYAVMIFKKRQGARGGAAAFTWGGRALVGANLLLFAWLVLFFDLHTRKTSFMIFDHARKYEGWHIFQVYNKAFPTNRGFQFPYTWIVTNPPNVTHNPGKPAHLMLNWYRPKDSVLHQAGNLDHFLFLWRKAGRPKKMALMVPGQVKQAKFLRHFKEVKTAIPAWYPGSLLDDEAVNWSVYELRVDRPD